jgi:hypothetical protein
MIRAGHVPGRTGAYRRDPAREAMVVAEVKKLKLFEQDP